jgi:hypothetical protein
MAKVIGPSKASIVLMLIGLILLVAPTITIPLSAVTGKIVTGISIGVEPKSGRAPLKIKIMAILWELRNNAWYVLGDKMLCVGIDGKDSIWGYSLKGRNFVKEFWWTFEKGGVHEIYIKFEGDDQYEPSTSRTVTVEVLAPYTLTILGTEGGTTDPPPGTYQYSKATTVAIYYKEKPTYDFKYWQYDSSISYDNPIVLTVDRDITLTAYFEEEKISLEYTLTVDKTEVPDVADPPVVKEGEMVEFSVTVSPHPITQLVELQVKKEIWCKVREFVIVNGKGSIKEAPGLYGNKGDRLLFRIYDPSLKYESNHVEITILAPIPAEHPIEEQQPQPQPSEELPPKETVVAPEEPKFGLPKETSIFGAVLVLIGGLMAISPVMRKRI